MKKLVVILLLVSQIFIFGQNTLPVPDAFSRRDHPVELRIGEINEGYKMRLKPEDKNFKDPEFKKVKYSPEQLERITYLLKNEVVPDGLITENKSKNNELMPYYKSYWVGNIKIDGVLYCLIYLPKKENMHMPADLIPPTDEGTYISMYVNAVKFANHKLAGTKPPSPEELAKAKNGNVTFSYANLSRWNNTQGIIIFWFGSSGTANSYKAYSVKYGNTISEEKVVQDLKSRYISDEGYIGYSFSEGAKCQDLYRDIARKMKISLESAQDLRLGNCSDNVINFE